MFEFTKLFFLPIFHIIWYANNREAKTKFPSEEVKSEARGEFTESGTA